MTTAVEVFGTLAQNFGGGDIDALLAQCVDDVVFEFPFAPPSRPRRVEGKPALAGYLKTVSGRLSIEGAPHLEMHETVNPDVAIVEMTLTGTVLATGAPFEQSYVSVLTVRDGLVVRYRDYWNPLGIAE